MSDWTKEPWHLEKDDQDEFYDLVNDDGETLIFAGVDDRTANRIVACINAFSGIKDPEAFVKAADALLKESVDTMKHMDLHTDWFCEALETYRKERGETNE